MAGGFDRCGFNNKTKIFHVIHSGLYHISETVTKTVSISLQASLSKHEFCGLSRKMVDSRSQAKSLHLSPFAAVVHQWSVPDKTHFPHKYIQFPVIVYSSWGKKSLAVFLSSPCFSLPLTNSRPRGLTYGAN